MATILFHMLEEYGHINPSLKIAQTLKKNNHSVCFIGYPEKSDLIKSKDINFKPILEKEIPKGLIENINKLKFNDSAKYKYFIKDYLFHSYIDGSIEKVIREVNPDLILYDIHHVLTGLIAHKLGIKYATLSVTLPNYYEDLIPPLHSCLKYNKTLLGNILHKIVWKIAELNRNRMFKEELKHYYPEWFYFFAMVCNYPVEKLKMKTTDVYFHLDLAPEIILCPGIFDFPRIQKPNRFFTESSINCNGEDEHSSINPDWINNKKHLIYCSMGSCANRYSNIIVLIKNLIDILRKRDDLQCIISLPKSFNLNKIGKLPENLLIKSWVPHSIYNYTDLIITHGGLSTIKESIFYGIPMLVFPQYYDQPGNAARVEYHKLGILQKKCTITKRKLEKLINYLLKNEKIKMCLSRMKNIFREEEQKQKSIEIIKHILLN